MVRYVAITLLVFGLAGCTSLHVSAVKKNPFRDSEGTFYVHNVPFVRQNYFYCGPASLESVLKFWGNDISQEEIGKRVYFGKTKGTFNFEMDAFCREEGFFTKSYCGTAEDIAWYIQKGIPVVVLQKRGGLLSDYHYMVLIGINKAENFIIAHDGFKSNAILPMNVFAKNWKHCNNWMLVIAPPEKVDWIKEADDYNRLGILFEEKGNPVQARDNYHKAIALKGSRTVYYFNLANAYLKEREFACAIAYYKKAIELSPEFADCYNNLAYALAEGELSYEEARVYALKALELGPDKKCWYMDTLGMVHLKTGNFTEATRNFEDAIKQGGFIQKEDADTVYKHLIESYVMAGLNDRS
ncbi:MAG: PA2778 family cysteine peptidase [Candidatus Omnitrophota bacterium]